MAVTTQQPPATAATTGQEEDPLYDPNIPWHIGEQEMQRLMRLPPRYTNSTSEGMPAGRYGARLADSTLAVLGTLDDRGRPWVSLTGGEAGGLLMPIAQDVLALKATVDVSGGDPVFWGFLTAWGEEGTGEGGDESTGGKRQVTLDKVVRPPDGGKMMAGLAMNLERRDRVKFAGNLVGGAMTGYATKGSGGDETSGKEEDGGSRQGGGEVQLAFHILETLGNCPKYINKKRITRHVPSPELVYDSSRRQSEAGEEGEGGVALPQVARELIDKADMIFLSSKYSGGNMDVNHRGGSPGFMRVLEQRQQDGSGKFTTTTALIFPEYSGNNFYQTLGNLRRDPQLGICVPDYDTGDVLYVTGTAEVLIGDKATAYLPRTKLAVKLDVEEARFVRDGLGFRGALLERSPYNPTVKYLTSEKHDITADPDALAGGVAVAKLKTRAKITETVARYTFALSRTEAHRKRHARLEPWEPGQYITLDFSEELDNGWRHSADDDPQSLNDDYVRSFTISAPIKKRPEGATDDSEPDEFEITVRRHGPVTAMLSRWNMSVPLEIPVLGFGGDPGFRLATVGAGKDRIFVAQGVGITPLIAQAPSVIESMTADPAMAGKFGLLWGLRAEDMLLAQDVLGRTPGLAEFTTLFVTGKMPESAGANEAAQNKMQDMGVKIANRRMAKDDVLGVGEKGRRKYHGCTSAAMRKVLAEWVEGEELVMESFDH